MPSELEPSNATALYTGWVQHRRYRPTEHAFRYPLFMTLLDLDHLPETFAGCWFWSHERASLARFRRGDHLGDSQQDLRESVRDFVHHALGFRPTGAVHLLTHLAYFGYRFNPVSFFYCYDSAHAGPVAIVAEITNTPWGERFPYALDCRHAGARSPDHYTFHLDKRFHVSPYMPMEIAYDWRFSAPRERLWIHMHNFHQGERIFDAAMVLQQRPWNAQNRRSVLLRYPFMTTQVIAGIYWQAARLWLKGTPVHTHPAKRTHA